MIPLEYGIPALGVAFIIYQIRAQMIARKFALVHASRFNLVMLVAYSRRLFVRYFSSTLAPVQF